MLQSWRLFLLFLSVIKFKRPVFIISYWRGGEEYTALVRELYGPDANGVVAWVRWSNFSYDLQLDVDYVGCELPVTLFVNCLNLPEVR